MHLGEDYYNFPITLLAGILDKPDKVLRDILAWATYDYIKRKQGENKNGAKVLDGSMGWQKIELAIEYLNYPQERRNYNQEQLEWWYHHCGEIYAKYKGARTGISRDKYWELRDRFSATPDEIYSMPYPYDWDTERVLWLAFLAAKSIVGNKSYCKTNDLMLFARMNGRSKAFANEAELKANSHPLIASYYTRKKRGTIRRMLAENFHTATYSNHDRGYYASTRLSLEKLGEVVESKRHSTMKSYNAKMRETRDRVLAKLGKKPP